MIDVVSAILALHRASTGPTLVVDAGPVADALATEPRVLLLSKTKRVPEEMWSLPGTGKIGLVVFEVERTMRELYRVLVLVERLVASGGKILVLQKTGDVGAFCEIYGWKSALGEGVVELSKSRGDGRGEDVANLPTHPAPSARNKHVISLSVFGPGGEHGYWRHLPTVIRAYLVLFPGYEIRIHHDDWIYRAEYGDVLHGLERRGLVKLVRMATDGIAEGKCKAMLWRLAPCWDPEVDYVFCRDVDSLPTWRDRMVCEEFVASGCMVGTIHDDPQHVGIMGGLCHVGAKEIRNSLHSFDDFIAMAGFTVEEWAVHGADQRYLNDVVRWAGGKNILEHSLFTVVGESGRVHRDGPTIEGAVFKIEIAVPSQEVIDSVPEAARLQSDSFMHYMGAAGQWRDDAKQFYEMASERTMEVDAAEVFAGWGS